VDAGGNAGADVVGDGVRGGEVDDDVTGAEQVRERGA
jgi:hypothetical protein